MSTPKTWGGYGARRRRTSINPGKYRHLVTFQKRTLTSDGRGGQTESWGDAFNWYVSVEPLSTRERLIAEQLEEGITHRIEGLYCPTINATEYRIKHVRGAGDIRYYNIRPPMEEDLARYKMTILCREVVGKEQ